MTFEVLAHNRVFILWSLPPLFFFNLCPQQLIFWCSPFGFNTFFWSRGWDRWDFPGPPASYNMYIQSWAQNCERPADGHLKLHSCRMKRPTGETDHVSNSVFDCLIVFHSDLPIYQFNFFIHLFNLCHLQQYFFVTTWTLTKFSDLSMFDLDFIRIDTPSELGSVKPDLLVF